MTLRKLLSYSIACLLTALPILSSCVDGGMADVSLPHEEADGSGVYVSVVVNTDGGARTRAGSPTPGEDGDGPQAGVGDENRVYDLNVFFFQTTDQKGLNTIDDVSQIKVVSQYFDQLTPNPSSTITHYTTPAEEVEGLNIGQTYEVLVVANAGNKFNTDISTLENLQNSVVTGAMDDNSDVGDGLKFLMASAGPDVNTIEIVANNSPYNAATVTVAVERLAARVDYKIASSYTTKSGDEVKLLSATLANKHETSPYVFKRVSKGTDVSQVTYLGNEEIDENTGIASNYVLDPQTFEMGSDRIYLLKFDNIMSLTSSPWLPITTDGEYHTLDYTEENIVTVNYVENDRAAYCTGIVFKGQYTPQGFTAGTTFYWYDNQAFVSLDKVKEYSTAVNAITDLSDDNCDQYGILKYEDGICYYTYWIRHADDGDPDKISPMEYAIVRNNIYQVEVASITTIGPPEPEDEVNAAIKVYVVNWDATSIKTEDVVWGDPIPSN